MLDITDHAAGDVTVLTLTGRLVLEDAEPLGELVERLFREQRTKLVVDLRDVSYIDSAGLGLLVAKYVGARRRGGDLRLVHLTARSHAPDVDHQAGGRVRDLRVRGRRRPQLRNTLTAAASHELTLDDIRSFDRLISSRHVARPLTVSPGCCPRAAEAAGGPAPGAGSGGRGSRPVVQRVLRPPAEGSLRSGGCLGRADAGRVAGACRPRRSLARRPGAGLVGAGRRGGDVRHRRAGRHRPGDAADPRPLSRLGPRTAQVRRPRGRRALRASVTGRHGALRGLVRSGDRRRRLVPTAMALSGAGWAKCAAPSPRAASSARSRTDSRTGRELRDAESRAGGRPRAPCHRAPRGAGRAVRERQLGRRGPRITGGRRADAEGAAAGQRGRAATDSRRGRRAARRARSAGAGFWRLTSSGWPPSRARCGAIASWRSTARRI